MTQKPKKKRKKNDFDWKNERVKTLFAFLERNTNWNKKFQELEYKRSLSGWTSNRDRLVCFLHLIVNTQSGVDMDALKPFWVALHSAKPEQTDSLSAFTAYFATQVETPKKGNTREKPRAADNECEWDALFMAMNAHFGWGTKTTALFVKATIKLHRGPDALHFWSDATLKSAPVLKSKPYLPVDRVILHIFRRLGHACPSVENINIGLKREYTVEQMLTWDDLWFWGFFTQTGGGDERTPGWNSAKFWGQLSSPKDSETELKALGDEFLRLLTDAESGTVSAC